MIINLSTTSATLLLNPNPKRRKLIIQMQATDVDSANTGRIHISFGQQGNATVGDVSQGDALIQSATIAEPSNNLPLDEKYKRAVWATSSQANQSLTIEEETEL